MKKVYVLIGSSGIWDDYSTWVIGVYSSEEIAKQEKEKYDRSIIYDKDKYSKEEEIKYEEMEDEILERSLSEEYPQELQDYVDWKMRGYEHLHKAKIEEFELDKLL